VVRFGLSRSLTSEHNGPFYRYVSTGSGRGNPYGLAAVFAACAFPFFYARLYLPWNQLTTIVFLVTALLVSVDSVCFRVVGAEDVR